MSPRPRWKKKCLGPQVTCAHTHDRWLYLGRAVLLVLDAPRLCGQTGWPIGREVTCFMGSMETAGPRAGVSAGRRWRQPRGLSCPPAESRPAFLCSINVPGALWSWKQDVAGPRVSFCSLRLCFIQRRNAGAQVTCLTKLPLSLDKGMEIPAATAWGYQVRPAPGHQGWAWSLHPAGAPGRLFPAPPPPRPAPSALSCVWGASPFPTRALDSPGSRAEGSGRRRLKQEIGS